MIKLNLKMARNHISSLPRTGETVWFREKEYKVVHSTNDTPPHDAEECTITIDAPDGTWVPVRPIELRPRKETD